MAKEATLYAPLITNTGGKVSIEFATDHPGYRDTDYQAHRTAIAKAALDHVPGTPAPLIAYTDDEHAAWRAVIGELREQHRRYACREFLEATDALDLPVHRLPQLAEVSARTERLTGFAFSPAAGLVDQEVFYGSLGERRFQATQYIRYPSMPRFSPEPDMIHEVVGHGSHLCSGRWARLYELLGNTVRRLDTREAISLVSRVFWFTLEYGLVREHGEIKACGASLLSSCGELEQFHQADIRPMDAKAMGHQAYRVEEFQPVLFLADSFAQYEDFLAEFLTGLEDDSPLLLS